MSLELSRLTGVIVGGNSVVKGFWESKVVVPHRKEGHYCTPVIEQSVNHFAKDNQPFGSRSDASKIGAPIEPKNVLTTRGQYSLLSCGPLCGANSRISPDSPRLKSAFQDTLKPLTLTYHAYFGVRYYPLDPTQIMDEQTRYQIFLQVRDDLVSGRMPVNEDMFVKLCGLSLQSDCGDYGEDKLGVDYVRRLLKMPHLSRALEARIKEKHAECKGRQPALVEYQFLECAKQCMSYGQVKFAVLDTVSNLGCLFGIGPAGVTIEETQSSLIHFSWMQISGFSGKSKHLSIHITDQTGAQDKRFYLAPFPSIGGLGLSNQIENGLPLPTKCRVIDDTETLVVGYCGRLWTTVDVCGRLFLTLSQRRLEASDNPSCLTKHVLIKNQR
ncbi:band 4.1-like protein 3 [Clonorchis sinensis]|uniref:Band 4.1-like protein 3 n=1 Tax=Clonorchis sinensis TaxID=79923 RepID=G7Y6G9_CLOSI|nr:band 4.1-like protein 3 [Clonorchis sinensis]